MPAEQHRFFAWVWRINGLLFFAAMVATLVAMGAVAFDVGLFASRDQPETELRDVAGADLVAEDLKLGSFRAVPGTDFLVASLAPPTEYGGSGSFGALGQERNLLFFNVHSKKAHWLLPSNHQEILENSFVFDRPSDGYDLAGEPDRYVVGVLLDIAPLANEPGSFLTRRLAFASASGTTVTTIAESIEGLLGFHHAAPGSLLVFYVRDGSVNVLDLDPQQLAVRSDSVLSTDD